MYCNYYDFTNYHRSIGESCDYDAMRNEISRCLFGSYTEFHMSDLIEIDGHNHSGESSGYNSSDVSPEGCHSWESSGYDSSDASSGSDYCSTDSYN
jgi:hypothetical protein